MQISLYAATVPKFLQILECENSLVHKAASYADAKGLAHDKLLNARLAPNDRSFRSHIRLSTREAVNVTSMLSGRAAALPRSQLSSFAELFNYISVAKRYLRELREGDFVDCEEKKFGLGLKGGEPVTCNAEELVFNYAYPTFYFHAVSAHAIMLQFGLGLSPWEFRNPPA